MNRNAQMVYDFLTEHPDRHDQSDWVTDNDGGYPNGYKVEPNFCGTTMCAAGAAVRLVKGKQAFIGLINEDNLYYSDPETGDYREKWVKEGADALQISYEQGQKIFSTMNNVTALELLKAVADEDDDEFERIMREEDRY